MPVRRYQLQRLEEVAPLAIELARAFPNRDTVMPGIYELLINAVEHGNLEIGYALKTALLEEGRWLEEVMARQSHPAHSGKRVEITLKHDGEVCEISIADQGNGFDWEPYIAGIPDTNQKHGRGLMIAGHCGFDRVQFNSKGNRVTCFSNTRQQ